LQNPYRSGDGRSKWKICHRRFLSAGEIITNLQDHELAEEALAAVMASTDPEKVDDAVLNSSSALRLRALGLEKDIQFSLKRNIYKTVPIYKDGIITKI